MTPATNNFREFETGNEFEPKVPIRFIGSATPVSDFLQLYDNRKTRENYRLAKNGYLKGFNPWSLQQHPEIHFIGSVEGTGNKKTGVGHGCKQGGFPGLFVGLKLTKNNCGGFCSD